MIEIRHLTKSFGDKKVLDDLSITFEAEKIHFIIGRSGTGKSVLLKSLVGLLTPDSGEIWLEGERVGQHGEEGWREVRRRCGMVFQSPALLDSLTVRENVAFGLRAHGLVDSDERELARVTELLTWVNISPTWLNELPTKLGFSLQKRVAIARTLALKPQSLLFDEPTTGLDPILTTRINGLIERLTRQLKVTSLVVSHDMHCALAIADRIYLLDKGRLVSSGTPAELRESADPLVKEFLREAKARANA